MVFMASEFGGMDIEEVAAHTPHLMLKETLHPGLGLMPFQGRNLAFGMGIPSASVNAAVAAMTALARANVELVTDAIASIGPDGPVTADGRTVPVDTIIIDTADTDTRVDPMHAKKMAALMQAEAKNGASKEKPILLRIETKAGHGQGKPVTKQIEENTDMYSFLFWQLGVKP